MAVFTAFKSISLIWLGLVLGAVIAFLTQAIMARALTLEEYGGFAAAINTVSMIAPLAVFGIPSYWLRQFGKYGWNASHWLKPSLRVVVLSLTLCIIGLVLIALFVWPDKNIGYVIVLLTPLIFMSAFSDLCSSRLQLEERYSLLAIWRIIPQAARLIVVIAVYFMELGLYYLAIGYCVSAFIIAFVGIKKVLPLINVNINLVGHGKKNESPALVDVPEINEKKIIRDAWPFAIGGVFSTISFQSIIVILSLLGGYEDAALYNAAFAIMLAIYLLPRAIFQQYLLPKYHRWSEHNRARFLGVYQLSNGVMLLLGVFVMVVLMLLGPILIPFVFGDKFIQAGQVLFWVALCVPIRFLSASVGGSLATKNNMRKKVKYQGGVALINILLALILIPMYQLNGAIVTTIVSEGVLLVLFLYGAKKHVFGKDALTGWSLNWKKLGN